MSLGALTLRKKTVKEAMTLLSDVYMLDKDLNTDAELLLDIHKHGFSRIPVYSTERFCIICLVCSLHSTIVSFSSRSNIIGIVKLRDFAFITPEQYHLTVKHVLEFHSRM